MVPNHTQLTDATTRFVTSVQASIAVLQNRTDALNVPTHEIAAKDPKILALCQKIVGKLGKKVSSVHVDWNCSDIDIRLGDDCQLVNAASAFPQIKSALVTWAEKFKNRDEKKTVCSAVEELRKLIMPTALGSWRTYVRAQWAPSKPTEMLTDVHLRALYVSFKQTKAPLSCSI